jgi:hypothetical protein
MNSTTGWKLFRLRKNGTLGPLFINRRQVVPVGGDFLPAEAHKTAGFAYRPGWHATPNPVAPHLKKKPKHETRVWCKVELKDVQPINKPEKQGGKWYLAGAMRVTSIEW